MLAANLENESANTARRIIRTKCCGAMLGTDGDAGGKFVRYFR